MLIAILIYDTKYQRVDIALKPEEEARKKIDALLELGFRLLLIFRMLKSSRKENKNR